MLKRLSALLVSLVFSFWALLAFAQQVKPGAVKKWSPGAVKPGVEEAGKEPPCIDGKDCMDKYGVETAAEALKVIELNKERVIKKRIGPGPVA